MVEDASVEPADTQGNQGLRPGRVEALGAGASLPGVSVVVPVFNSEQTLRELCERLSAVLAARSAAFEIILVNDGSQDGSWSQILGLVDEVPGVRGFNFMRNYGQHNAVLCGIRCARHEVIVTLDDDLQNPPEEIPRLLERLAEGYDVVYGTPNAESHGFWRDRVSQIFRFIVRTSVGSTIGENISSFRALRTNLRGAFADFQGTFVSVDVLLTWATSRFGTVRVKHVPRAIGESNYTVGRLFTLALSLLTGFSILPLRLVSAIGFACSLFGIGVLAHVLFRVLVNGVSVPGFAFLASIIAIFSGAQLFTIGIIGEYLNRMYVRTMNRPSYVVLDSAEATTDGGGT
jgi:undecaprenyl-phosphate 4-deoxy-4-formamido-L-arabinose transferase